MDSLCRVRCKLVYVLSWRIVHAILCNGCNCLSWFRPVRVLYNVSQTAISVSKIAFFSSAIKQYDSLDHRHQNYSHDSVIVKYNNDRMNDIFNRITCILLSIANEIFISRTLEIVCNAVRLGDGILYQYLEIPPFILTWRASKPVLRLSILPHLNICIKW